MERHPCTPERDGLAVADRLCRTGEAFAVAQAHEIERLLRGKHGAMAGPRVVAMRVGDDSFFHCPRRIDMEAADPAADPGGCSQQDVFGPHGSEI
jgi:hypothetical protein